MQRGEAERSAGGAGPSPRRDPQDGTVKFVWFNLMPWPHLPADFRARHRSVWVDIPNTLYDPKKGHQVYHEYLDQLEYAETLGFDGIGCNEHHQNGYGLMPSPNLIAATLSRRTSRAALCVIGNSIASYNPPIRVAEEFAMLDVISGGRLVAGFPVGTPMDTNFCYGQIPALTRDKYREAHDLIAQLLGRISKFQSRGGHGSILPFSNWVLGDSISDCGLRIVDGHPQAELDCLRGWGLVALAFLFDLAGQLAAGAEQLCRELRAGA